MYSKEKRGTELAQSVSRFRYVFQNRSIGVQSLAEAEILPPPITDRFSATPSAYRGQSARRNQLIIHLCV